MIDKTKYAIIARRELTGSGQDEIVATFVKRQTAEQVLRSMVPNAQDRRFFYKIEKLEKP